MQQLFADTNLTKFHFMVLQAKFYSYNALKSSQFCSI